MNSKIAGYLKKPLLLAVLLVLITAGITTQSVLSGEKKFENDPHPYSHYNNYEIFKQSYFHLVNDQDLYELYPEEHYDYYKYSPTFALLMAPLAYTPDGIGLFIWNLLNVLILFYALWQFPELTDKKKLLILAILLIELITSLQNSQSNGLIAGLLVWAFVFMEKKQIIWASLLIVLTAFIKIFGILALLLFLFYSDKIKAALYTILWSVVLLVLPLLVVSVDQLVFLYKSWLGLLKMDHDASYGLSVAGWLYTWFNWEVSKNILVLAGFILLLIPALKLNCYKNLQFRVLMLCSILLWLVIFNHKAESPTFVIAVTGVGLWYFTQKSNTLHLILLVLAIVFTILSPTDFFPKSVREDYVLPYVLKAVPCIFIWLKITYDLIRFNPEKITRE